MKLFKFFLITLIILTSLVFAKPSLADKPKFLKNPDYIEVTKALKELSSTKDAQILAKKYTPEEIEQKIAELEFQKYTLETGLSWGQCSNETGKTLGVYGQRPNSDDDDDDDEDYPYENALYFLADGQTTKNKWDCDGVYLPSDAKVPSLSNVDLAPTSAAKSTSSSTKKQPQELNGAVAIKIVDGTKLVVKTNAQTGGVEFSIPPAKVFKAGEAKWFIPNVTQTTIEARVANAPIEKS